MKQAVIFCILVVLLIYGMTGRYITVQENIEQKGFIVLIDEPLWFWAWLGKHCNRVKQTVQDFVDGEMLQ